MVTCYNGMHRSVCFGHLFEGGVLCVRKPGFLSFFSR